MVSEKVTIKNLQACISGPQACSAVNCHAIWQQDYSGENKSGCNSECQSVLSVLGACIKSGDEIRIICEETTRNRTPGDGTYCRRWFRE